MTTYRGSGDKEPPAALEARVRALEERVTLLTEALRVLAHGLEDLPAAEPKGSRSADAARQAHDLLLSAPGG